ncbi:MAG: hypothetical protein NC548_05420 [Lachnospiraceae bacterium]|nr:hypothetical protein [Lachnospiraceae bacterium]
MIDSKLYEEVAGSTNVISGDEYQKLFCTVAQVVSDIVGQTLGPYGATTIIDDGGGFTYPTKDGWSCMNRLRFSDPVYNSIYSIQKQVSFNSVSTVGDGTTTAQVATSYFLNEFFNYLLPMLKNSESSFSQADFIKAMNETVDELCSRLRKNPNIHKISPDGDFEDIYRVAYIATNGNEKFASMIQQIYAATKNPNIRVEIDGGSPETISVIEKGYRFDCKVISYRNYVDSTDGTIHWGGDQPFSVFILDHNVTFNMHRLIVPTISQLASKMGRKIMIMAPYFDDLTCGEIDAQVTALKRQGQEPNIVLVQIPLAARLHQEAIQDLSILSNALICTQSRIKFINLMIQNASVVREEDKLHDPIEEYEEFKKYAGNSEMALRDCLGTCASVMFDNSNGYLQDYDKYCDKKRYEERMWQVTKDYETRKIKADKTLDGTLDKDFLAAQTHYIRLTGNCGVIKVGGASDIQRRCDKDALDDATLACKSAYQYGYVRGMGLEILKVCELDKLPSDEMKAAIITAIFNAFRNTIARIIANKYNTDIETLATMTGAVGVGIIKDAGPNQLAFQTTIGSLVDEIVERSIEQNQCFDLRKMDFQSPGLWTVINSVQTDIEILRAMTTIVTTIMTSSQFLSMSKAYDNKLTHEKALRNRADDEAVIAQAKARSILDIAAEKGWTPSSVITSCWSTGSAADPIESK